MAIGAGLAGLAGLAAVGGCGGDGAREGGPPSGGSRDAVGEHAGPPNVVLIVVDTMRGDHLGAWGHPDAWTPEMDRLARQAAQFETCVSQVPVTAPSTSTILTGTTPPFHGVRDNGSFVLREGVPTVAEEFAAAGWSTGAFLSASVLDERWGIGRGFETWDDDVSRPYRFHRPELSSWESSHQGVERRADDTTQRAIAWMRVADAPFFLLVHYFDPHAPADPPLALVRPGGGSYYDAEISSVDRAIGRLRDALEAAGALDRTLVALTADHGEGGGEHGELTHGFFVYDSTMRVPLLFRGAGTPPGVVRGQVRLTDVAATLLDLAGARAGPDDGDWGQGRSLASVARREERLVPEPAYLENWRVRHSYGWSELVGLRTERWKYVRAPRPELYDLAADPGELVDLHSARPDTASALSAALDRFLAEAASPEAPAEPSPIDEETARQLAALGYVGGEAAAGAGGGGGAGGGAGSSRPDPKDEMEAFNRRHETKNLVGRAVELRRRGRAGEAWGLLDEAIAGAPDAPFPRWMRGTFLKEDGRTDEARRAWEETLEIAPEHAKSLLDLAASDFELGDGAAARRRLESAWATRPRAEIRDALWHLHLADWRWEEAIEVARAAGRADPADVAPVHLEAYALGLAERTDEEAALLRDRLPADDPTARYRGAELEVRRLAPRAAPFLRADRFDRALPHLEEARRAHPGSGPLAWALGTAIAETGGDFETASGLLAAPDPDPVRDGRRRLARGRALLAAGRPADAARELAAAAEATEGVFAPYLVPLRLRRGLAEIARGRTEVADRRFEALLAAGWGPFRPTGSLDVASIRRLALTRAP